MKILTAGMETMVESHTRTLGWAMTFTRKDAQVFRYCSGTRDKIVGGNTFTAAPGFVMSSITATQGATTIDTLDVTVLPSNDVEKADFLAGRWFGTTVDVAQFNWANVAHGFITWNRYILADIKPRDGAFVLELRDTRIHWKQDYTLHTGKECQNRLGDAKCGKVLTTFTHTFTVTGITNARRIFTASGLAQAADYFTEGECIFDTGLHADLSLLIADHGTGGVITLAVPTIEDIAVSMTGTIIAGCLKRLEDDCKTKFNNVLRFRSPGVHAPTVEESVGG